MFYGVKGDGAEKEAPPAPTKKQPVQEKAAAVPPVKAAAVEVTTQTLVAQPFHPGKVQSCSYANVLLVTFF